MSRYRVEIQTLCESIDINFIENGPVVYESIDGKQTNKHTLILILY